MTSAIATMYGSSIHAKHSKMMMIAVTISVWPRIRKIQDGAPCSFLHYTA